MTNLMIKAYDMPAVDEDEDDAPPVAPAGKPVRPIDPAEAKRIVLSKLRIEAAMLLQKSGRPATDVELDAWHAPVEEGPQRVELMITAPPLQRVDGFGRRELHPQQETLTIEWAPGETLEIPALFRRAIHTVVCKEKECQGKQPCTKGHPGSILGGQAPRLQRVHGRDVIHRALLVRDEPSTAPAAPGATRRTDAQMDPAIAAARARRAKGGAA